MTETPSPFLGVACSLSGRVWRERPGDARTATAISRSEGLSEITARVLANRGVTADTAAAFLKPQLKTLPDPSSLKDMDLAAERLADAAQAAETVVVFADYDVDGATSGALLARFLRAAGGDARLYVPDRMTEGYGPNAPAFDRLAAEGHRLVVMVDCGTTAHEPLAHAAKLGLECIVIDHHLPKDDLPKALALVNPRRADETGLCDGLAAVGIAFLLVIATNRALRRRGHYSPARPEPDLRTWLDLVALGTVADVMTLTGINRTLVTRGLEVMAQRGNTGIAALLAAASVEKPPTAYDLGFVLGPRINAGGRIGDSSLGARLLSTENSGEATSIAEVLNRLNTERRKVEADVLAAALASAPAKDDPLVFAVGEGWHPGVVGIVASRLVNRFRRPALVGGLVEGEVRGSARSIPGVPIGPAVLAARDAGLLLAGGGHDMAAGFTVSPEKQSAFEAFLIEHIGPLVPAGGHTPPLNIDAGLSVLGASDTLLRDIEAAQPFGRGNPEPVFAFPDLRVRYSRIVGENHVRADLADASGSRLAAVAFRAAATRIGEALMSPPTRRLHVAGTLRADDWRGKGAVQLIVSDVALAA